MKKANVMLMISVVLVFCEYPNKVKSEGEMTSGLTEYNSTLQQNKNTPALLFLSQPSASADEGADILGGATLSKLNC